MAIFPKVTIWYLYKTTLLANYSPSVPHVHNKRQYMECFSAWTLATHSCFQLLALILTTGETSSNYSNSQRLS